MTTTGRLPADVLAGLGRRARSGPPEERCELCGTALDPGHRHMLDVEARRILCTCEICLAMKAGMASLRPVGTRTAWLPDLDLSDEQWASFGLPVGLAFFFRSSANQAVVALYPSPAGATEAELDMIAWQRLLAANPVLKTLEPDAEALVVNRMDDPAEHAIVPVDECYRLVGLIMATWTGISGGSAIEDAVPAFFAGVRRAAGAHGA